MQTKIVARAAVLGVAIAMAWPTAARANGFTGFFPPFAPSFAYQNPDGSYPSYTDFSRDLWGMPCGIQCTERAAVRWGLVPPPPPHIRYGHR